MIEEELVDEAFQCPVCGENCMDALVWITDAHISCASCGEVYQLDGEEDLCSMDGELLACP